MGFVEMKEYAIMRVFERCDNLELFIESIGGYIDKYGQSAGRVKEDNSG